MEPEIIRMYSSSPPPLDNGAEEEEDDEFGDFGGFSGAGGSTSVGFDFGLDYSNSKEEHESPYNADYSNSVDGIIAFTPARYINDSDSITELQNSIKGLPDSASKEKCECRRLGASFNELNSAEVNRTERSEAPHSEIIRTDRKAARQDQQIDSYYGKRLLCPEVLTNGFAALDAANPPGVEDLDSISDSKTLKTTSTHSIDLSLDSVPSTVEDFADFAKFSNKQAAQVEETGNKICKNSSEREALGVHESNIINSAGQGESMKEVASDGSCEHEGETCTESELVCISTTNVVIREDVKGEEDCRTLECADAFSSMQTNVNSVGTTESIEGRGEGDAGNSKERDFSQTSDTASLLNLDVSNVQDLGCLPAEEHVPISEIVKNGESELGQASLSDLNEDDFGDFGTVSNGSPAFADGVQVSVSQEDLQTPLEKQINKPSNECGPFLGRSDSQQIAMVAPLETSDISRSGLEECQSAGPGSGIEMPLAEMENENDREFGDFDSVTKRCLDADDFSDFSSAGCSQATEWNAFECDQKESCSWAAFGDEQIVGSPHEQDVWPAHRTDATASSEDSVLHKTDSISITTFHGSGSRQLHELPTSAQTMLLSRLERIFEACFPTVPVCEIEEEIVPLNLLLEAGSTPGRPAEPLSERELLDVWAELQDIHDAYGLRYQWGGSHSNKKLLCSLGIDTRNILFTGNKKQPFIVPMYAAGLGMLEPTKEPLKPISAAEKIASIGQTLPVSPEMNICTSDQFQESLPPVQFDWSTSGLTNPLDASGGSSLLNLDFFGPVDDSSSSASTTIPGVDPELYELTTSKLEATNVTNKVTDAFAKLMSTVEKASTSARKPKKEERLSEEAAQVIASLPDLTFMHAKVLMFPATLTPSASCQDQVD